MTAPCYAASMRTAEQWFEEYGASHRHPTNKRIHWVCVPLILCSTLGLLQSVPLAGPGPLHLGTLGAVVALAFYATLGLRLFIAMAAVLAASLGLNAAIAQVAPLWGVSAGVWLLAWVAQFYGHELEGKKPSFFKDLQFLLVGPAWVVNALLARRAAPSA